jgi:CRISPR/Cas system-associated protein Cas7 (RAMP superfamily)
MTLEKELLDFTNWLYNNNWKLIGNGMCLNTETKEIGLVKQLAMESVSFGDYYPQDFQVGDKVKEVDSEEIVEIKEVIYNKFDDEYQYWYEGEDGEEVYGFSEDFEKID